MKCYNENLIEEKKRKRLNTFSPIQVCIVALPMYCDDSDKIRLVQVSFLELEDIPLC